MISGRTLARMAELLDGQRKNTVCHCDDDRLVGLLGRDGESWVGKEAMLDTAVATPAGRRTHLQLTGAAGRLRRRRLLGGPASKMNRNVLLAPTVEVCVWVKIQSYKYIRT